MLRDKQMYKDAALQLKARRQAKGLSVGALAARLGVSTARYRTWEKIFGPLPQRQYGSAVDRILSPEDEDAAIEGPDLALAEPLDLVALGGRAKERRRQIGLSAAGAAALLQVSAATIRAWEARLPAKHRGDVEDAWEALLRAPRGWLRDLAMEAEGPHDAQTHFELPHSACLSIAEEIRAVGTYLAEPRSRRAQPVSGGSKRAEVHATMFAARYGVSGPDATTLQDIGNRFGLTRERVRQILERMLERARGASFSLPAFTRLRTAVSEAGVCLVADFESAHAQLLGGVSLADADRFAREVLGTNVASIVSKSFGRTGQGLQPALASRSTPDLAASLRDAARRMTRSSGAAHALTVVGMVSEDLGQAVSLADAKQALRVIEGMEWLTEHQDWFWLGADAVLQNRVLEAVRKILATAATRVDVEDLHQGICRSRRTFYRNEPRARPPELEMPQDVLRVILARVPWLSVVQKNDFVLREPLRREDVLNSSELAVVEVIKEFGGATVWHVLNRRLVDSGVFSPPSLHMVLAHSPVVKPLGYGIYGLRGIDVSREAYAAALDSGARTAVALEPAHDGWLEFSYSISEAALRSGVADLPMRVVNALPEGDYKTEGIARGTFSVGTSRAAPSRSRGLASLLRTAGVKPGEPLLVRVHPKTLEARIVRRTVPAPPVMAGDPVAQLDLPGLPHTEDGPCPPAACLKT